VHPGDLPEEFSDLEMTWLLYCAGAATDVIRHEYEAKGKNACGKGLHFMTILRILINNSVSVCQPSFLYYKLLCASVKTTFLLDRNHSNSL